jgi:hypothetical protein
LNADPDCLVNLVDLPEKKQLARHLREELFTRLTQQEDPRMLGQGDTFDRYPHASEGTRNFYERYKNGEKMEAGWVWSSDFENDIVD